jgi:hypothetical protein
MAKRGPKAKNPFEKLDEELRNTFDSMADEAIRLKLSEIALNREATEVALKDDMDVKEKAFALNEAKAGYRDAINHQKLMTKYLRQLLDARGKDSGTACEK